MDDNDSARASSTSGLTRRAVIKRVSVSAGALSIGGASLVTAKDSSQSESDDKIREFDPSSKESVKKAVQQSSKINSTKEFNRELERFSEKQQSALINGLKAVSSKSTIVDTGAVTKMGGQNTSVRTRVKNAYGLKLFDFFHHLNWNYNSRRITDKRHYKTTKIYKPGWDYKKLVTNRLYNADRKVGVSILEGKFRLCVGGNFGCVQSKTPGTRIYFYTDGSYRYNQI